MKWSGEFATGIMDLDEQHKRLFKMSEDYREALDEGRGQRVFASLLVSLDQYARGHFSREEQCMYRLQCPAARINSEAHGQFLKALAGFAQRYARDGFSRSDAQDLIDFIDGWLATHIADIDVRLKPYAENGGRGEGAPGK